MSEPFRAPEPAAPSNQSPTAGAAPASSRQLVKSTVVAIVVAAVLLVMVVMPAEYGVDPTGVGRVLGLTSMGDIKMSLEKEAAEAERGARPDAELPPTPADALASTAPAGAGTVGAAGTAAAPAAASDPGAAPSAGPSDTPQARPGAALNTHVTQVALAPDEGTEIKLVMRKGSRVTFSWSTDRGAVNYDLHADAPGIDYHSYAKASGRPSDEGVLVAAFDGNHGWFWRNRGGETVTLTLTTDGDYQELKRM